MFIASGLFFLTACGPSDSTDQTCQRLDDLQQELAKFEQDPPEDADQRWIAAESIAAEFDNIRDSTQNPELAEAADAFSEFYWAALQVHSDNLLLAPDQILYEVAEQIGVQRFNSANMTYDRVCIS